VGGRPEGAWPPSKGVGRGLPWSGGEGAWPPAEEAGRETAPWGGVASGGKGGVASS